MAGFDYGRMQGTATRLLTKFNQGAITLIRVTPGAADPDRPWVVNPPTTTSYPLQGAVRRVEQKYVNGTTIVETDDQINFAVPPIVPNMSDKFTVDGKPRVLKDLRPLPAAGTPVAYIAFVGQ